LVDRKEIDKMMRRSMYPEGFTLKNGPILIDVVDRTYGVYCECGSRYFSEDTETSTLFCSECSKILAVRAIEDGWINE
jgi:hypothetical protein